MGFFARLASFKDYFANSNGGLLFEMAFFSGLILQTHEVGFFSRRMLQNIENNDYRIMSKTTTEVSNHETCLKVKYYSRKTRTRSRLKCQLN